MLHYNITSWVLEVAGEMGWLRPKIGFGTWLALAALALNLAFAFGHHHFEEAAARGLAATHHVGAPGHADHGDDDHDGSAAAHPCLTCVVVSAAAVAASPPALPAKIWRCAAGATAAMAFDPRQGDRTSFEARAPPHA
jgi:hypothetical protein